MNRSLTAASLLLVFLAAIRPAAAWQECGQPRVFPFSARGPNGEFFEEAVLAEGAVTFPGLQTGELSFGGRLTTAYVKQRVPIQITRVETYYVIVFVDGRPRREARQRVVQETIFAEQFIARTVGLPQVTGKWQALDLCLFSWWNCISLGPGGLIAGGGTTTGDRLAGAIVCLGVDGLPSGVYQLTSGYAGQGGEEPPP